MPQSPNQIADYVFQYSFIVSFLGASFYGISSLVSVDPTTIVANKNVSVAMNAVIGLSGFIALFVWYNMSVPILDGTVINSKTVKTAQN